VSSEPTICSDEPDQSTPAENITASTPEGLASGTLSITYGGGHHVLTNPGGAVDTNGPGTDPIVGQPGCRTDNGSDLGGYTGYSVPLPNHTTYVGLGEVDVRVTLAAALQAQLDARVWDVPPSGPAFLVTRGTYRIDVLNGFDRPAEDIRLPLFGNHWRLPAGHRIRLDLTQVDQPYLRPNNEPSLIAFGSPTLVLPTRESQQQTLTGTP
jgi:predicted acyl esterase